MSAAYCSSSPISSPVPETIDDRRLRLWPGRDWSVFSVR